MIIDKSKWKPCKLIDVVTKKEENDRENAKNRFDRFLKVEHMDAGSLHIKRWSSQKEGEEINPYFYKIFRKGQILFPTRNPHLKRTALASFDGITGEKTLTLEPNQNLLIPEFIPFLFHSESFYKHTTSAIIGSTNPHVRWRDVANYEFLLPPKAEQARLAELLWAMDEVIENEIELLNKLKSTLYSYTKHLFENEESKIQIKHFVTNIKSKKAMEGIIPYLEIGDINIDNKTIEFKSKVSVKGSIIANDNSILISKVRPNRGAICFLKESNIVSNGFAVIQPKSKEVNPKYLFHCLAWNLNFFNLMARLATGSTYPTISDDDILNYSIPSLNLIEQNEYTSKMENIYLLVLKLEIKISNSQFLYKSLINQIF